jgi:hypothetical protein
MANSISGVVEQRERRRLDAIAGRQPGRYNGMKKYQKKK